MILNLPYTSLRTFEVVARYETFSAAANELGVSQSAVSQHVKQLEEWLGHQLIQRGARRSVPTKQGEILARSIAKGLGQISDTCEEIRDKNRADNSIIISCLPGFAFLWLFPRLLRFDLAHPDLSISITTDIGISDFSATDADIGIRYGVGNNPGCHVKFLMGEALLPVCAPAYLETGPSLTCIADLAHHTLLRDELMNSAGTPPSWEYWALENGTELPTIMRQRRFGQSNMVIQAAIDGIGVALGREPLVIDALHNGKLVQPFAETARSQYKYWLVCSTKMRNSANVQLFFDWIESEALAQRPIPELQQKY
ncbi:MAG: LysR substrate-binding domain-containing protein [Paracoccaceae bacterium]